MKRYILYIMCLVATVVSLTAAKPDDTLQFDDKAYDFGTIADSHAPVVHEYRFVNTADAAVAILSVSTGCGCTRPEYPIKPVAAGHKDKIKITFLPKGQMGSISRDIKVRYRVAGEKKDRRVTLRLRGNVLTETDD